MKHPALRPVDAYPIEHEGESYFIIRDPEGIAEGAVMLSPAAFFVAAFMDGQRDTNAICRAFEEKYDGAKVHPEEVEQVAEQLDRRFMLLSDTYRKEAKRIHDEFRSSPIRKAVHAGASYAADEDELTKQLTGFFEHSEGAGAFSPNVQKTRLSGILAPHIDFHRGGTCYTHAYRRLAEAPPSDLYVILGVAHASPPTPFVLTRKTYETPFGDVPADAEFIDRLVSRWGDRTFEHENVHRMEHSAEFQCVFLRYLHRERAVPVVPILCSSFEPHCGEGSPSGAAIIEDALQALAETLRTDGRRICVVAGVDLAHVGPRFGDPMPVDAKLIRWMERDDRVSLKEIEKGDAEGFWQSVMADGNRRKVCGLSAIYSTLRVLGGLKGEILKYGYAPDPAGGMVSFVSAALNS